ncbi:alpha/beta hydrolase [Actinoplanes bogorensis]|uniref:Alpha/beta hydrolase n=1 Tax=Paractinoplanes bogorensis TaxID=1610840 RepID=A0ABS5YUF1_9ACTN|nr:alpha/beta hydrolase [Actinoplanes bogorensis]MBU2666961.1 alpha/beta hydrolase [Actinoplanes bogorensis]
MNTYLLLHGGAGSQSMRAFADLLTRRTGTRVLVPTHPGFAGTERPDHLDSVAALARHYDTMLDEQDLHDVIVIGNSIGGWVAAEMALLGNPRLAKVVLVNAVGLDVPEQPVTDVSNLTGAQLAALSFHAPEKRPVGPGPDVGALRAYTGMRMTDPTLRERLAGVKVPVHVVWGASDGIVSPAYGRAWADAIAGAGFTLLPEAGHLPQLEAPERLLALV